MEETKYHVRIQPLAPNLGGSKLAHSIRRCQSPLSFKGDTMGRDPWRRWLPVCRETVLPQRQTAQGTCQESCVATRGGGGIDRESPHMAVKVGAHIEDPRHLFTAMGTGHWQCPAVLGGQEGNQARQNL